MALQFKSSTGFDYVSAATPLPVTIVGGGTGDVDGPSSATNNALAIFDGTTGKLLKNSAVTLTGTAFLGIGATDLTFTAGGTNQNITLTPSGTGFSRVVGASRTISIGDYSGGSSNSAIYMLGTATAPSNTNYAFLAGAADCVLNAQSGVVGINIANSRNATFTSTLHALLGGLTTDGTGVLQFPAGAADNTSGITFGADTWLYRGAAGDFSYAASGSSQIVRWKTGTTTLRAYLNCTSGNNTDLYSQVGALNLGSNGALALALDSSQNATFSGIIQGAGTVRLNGAGNGTLIAGTGNSRTMALQTTTSGGVATTWVSADATQNATFAGSITTSAPAGGAGAWELGTSITSGTSVLDVSGYVEIEIGGVLVKLARVTNS